MRRAFDAKQCKHLSYTAKQFHMFFLPSDESKILFHSKKKKLLLKGTRKKELLFFSCVANECLFGVRAKKKFFFLEKKGGASFVLHRAN